MKAIILAAGMGNRLLHLTTNTPKCKLKVYGKPIIEHQLDVFKDLGINDISIVKGFMKEQINYPETKSYYNDDYKNSNILSSLFCAENELNDDVIVTYSDIVFDKSIIEKIIDARGDICIAVEENWLKAYKQIEEIEKIVFKGDKVKRIGKHLGVNDSNGEFIGIAKFTRRGFEKDFGRVNMTIIQKNVIN